MRPATLEGWVWVLIYGGVVLSMLGLWSLDRDARLGLGLLGLGIVVAALGLAGIVWRARMGRQAGPGTPR